MSSAPRITPGGWREVGPVVWALSRVGGRVSGSGPVQLFLTLGRHRKLFWGWIFFARRLMPSGTLPRRETELAILRVATLTACDYELAAHRRMSRRHGVSNEEIERIALGPSDAVWSERERVLLESVDSLLSTGDIDDVLWPRVRAGYSDTEIIELVMLVGHYKMLATTIRTLRILPDAQRVRGYTGGAHQGARRGTGLGERP